jgi:hypothetical protein
MTEQEIEEVRRRLEARGIRPGAKPRGPRYVETSVMLDRDEMAELDVLAAAEGRSRSWMIREAVRRTWLKKKRKSRDDS